MGCQNWEAVGIRLIMKKQNPFSKISEENTALNFKFQKLFLPHISITYMPTF